MCVCVCLKDDERTENVHVAIETGRKSNPFMCVYVSTFVYITLWAVVDLRWMMVKEKDKWHARTFI